jgi:hypothetical protein
MYGVATALNVLLFLQFIERESSYVSIRRSVTFTVDTLPFNTQ